MAKVIQTPRNSAGEFDFTNIVDPTADVPESSRYIRLDLPSQYYFYPRDDIHVRPYTFMEAIKLHYARSAEDTRTVYEVVAQALSEPEDFGMLTEGDFMFSLYWHRLNSYPKSPAVVTVFCNQDEHNEKVIDGLLPPESLKIEQVIHQSDLEMISLDGLEGISEFVLKVQAETGTLLTSPNMKDAIALLAERRKYELKAAPLREAKRFDELDTLSRDWAQQEALFETAKYLNTIHGQSLQERVAYLGTIMDTGLLSYISQFRTLTFHGVEEFATVECPECGHKNRYRLEVGIPDFFPGL